MGGTTLPRYQEEEVVRMAEDYSNKGDCIPKGAEVTIIHVYPSGAHFEVEYQKMGMQECTALVHISHIEKMPR